MASSKKHHWWPQCVSNRWVDADGFISRLSPVDECIRLTPKNCAVIGHGHTIKLSVDPNHPTEWDHNFEGTFQCADDSFPNVIEWLEELQYESCFDNAHSERFRTEDFSEKKIATLVECIVSLAVRSPLTRHLSVDLAVSLRGGIPERERNALIGLNIQHRQRTIVDALGTHGKFVAIYSPDREFIFGDGFFHNIGFSAGAPPNPEVLVPLTPHISVLFAKPPLYTTVPKFMTLALCAKEADFLNQTVQVYSKDMIFFRAERPVVVDEFRQARHLRLDWPNPIQKFIQTIPGVLQR